MFFSDPVIFYLYAFFAIIIVITNKFMGYVWNKIEFWKIKTDKEKQHLESI